MKLSLPLPFHERIVHSFMKSSTVPLPTPNSSDVQLMPMSIEVLLEHETEGGEEYDAGAMIVRRFSRFCSYISPSKTGRRSLVYAAPIIPQPILEGEFPLRRAAPTHQSLIIGTDAFTTYLPAAGRLQNMRWKYCYLRKRATFSLTVSANLCDRDKTEPGVLGGKDILLQKECSFLRVAVGDELAITKDWGIYRCFAYPDLPSTSPAKETGLLRIPLTLMSRTQHPRNDRVVPYIYPALEAEWADIPEHTKHNARLLFPLGYTSATVTHLVQYVIPPMFQSEMRTSSRRGEPRGQARSPEMIAEEGAESSEEECYVSSGFLSDVCTSTRLEEAKGEKSCLETIEETEEEESSDAETLAEANLLDIDPLRKKVDESEDEIVVAGSDV